MSEAATLEKAKSAVISPELNSFETYIAPQNFESAVVALRGATASADPNLPALELTDGSSKPAIKEPEDQRGGKIQRTQTAQPVNENTEQSIPNSAWYQRHWSGLSREEIVCGEIKWTLGVTCDNLKTNQESSASTANK